MPVFAPFCGIFKDFYYFRFFWKCLFYKLFLVFKKAYRINPQFDSAIINIANVLSLKDKNLAAINFYDKALKINPNRNELYSNITICYCRLKDLENAKKFY